MNVKHYIKNKYFYNIYKQLETYSDKYGEIAELITKNKEMLNEYKSKIKTV